MKILKGIANVGFSIPAGVVTIGNFDGVHLGHREIINQLKQRASRDSQTSVVYTFRPHPHLALKSEQELQLINTYDEKIELLASLGVDVVVEEPFSREFSTIAPEDFFNDILMKKLSAQALYVGYDFGFGKGRAGNLELLQKLCDQNGVELVITKPLKIDGAICSSSRIREHLKNGEVSVANRLLGREFFYRGLVVKGFGRGHQIGFPTANIQVPLKLQVKTGVYGTRVLHKGKLYGSVTNVGYRPTFADPHVKGISIETHIFDFNDNVYGEVIEVRFIDRIRDEMKFAGVEELKAQIGRDIVSSKGILAG